MNCFTNSDRSLQNDFYSILGCCESSTIDQIIAEYKHQALLCHPDKHPDDDGSQMKKFQELQEAKDVLTDTLKRKEYDQWRLSGITIPYKQWVEMRKSTNVVFHWAVSKPNEGKMLESNIAQEPHSSHCSPITFRSQNQKTSPQPVFSKAAKDDILHKFRTYQI